MSNNIYLQGWHAFFTQKKDFDNPFFDQEEYHLWLEGFRDAELYSKSRTRTDDIYLEGWDAAINGQKRKDNPHTKKEDRELWLLGFVDGQTMEH